jgi:hypothetical protein
MRIACLLLLVGVVLTPFGQSTAQPAAPQNTLTPAERRAGWRLLFDGKTTAGWRGYRETGMRPDWTVTDGALTLLGGGVKHMGIVTVEQFENFELLIDWRIAGGGNSGIMYRVSETAPEPHLTGPEVQLLDNARHPEVRRNPARAAGACYDLYAPARDVTRPPGEWNTLRLLVNGSRVEHWLNGTKIVEYEIGSPDWQQRLARSKWRREKGFSRKAKGHLCLQEHNSRAQFRNIKIRSIGAE